MKVLAMPSFWAKIIVNACYFDPEALPMPLFWPEGIANAFFFTLNGKFSLSIGMIMPLGWGEITGIIPKLVTQGSFRFPLVTYGFATYDTWGIQLGFRDTLGIIFSFHLWQATCENKKTVPSLSLKALRQSLGLPITCFIWKLIILWITRSLW